MLLIFLLVIINFVDIELKVGFKEEYYFGDNKVKNCWSESVVRKGKKMFGFWDWLDIIL